MLPLLLFSLLIGVGANPYGCPTNVTCIEKETCCQTSTGLWACCPIEDGVCCNDGLHCCSKGQTCSADGSCTQQSNNQIHPAYPLRNREVHLNSVPCGDGSSCADGYSCCPLASGHFGCCPIPDAVCCSDHLHCCPAGHVCEEGHRRCRKQFDVKNDLLCPDGVTECSTDQTCCQLSSGDYACCPLAAGVCCNDHVHCCPKGSKCDVDKGRCIKDIVIPWLKKTPAFHVKQKMIKLINNEHIDMSKLKVSSISSHDIICPDGTSTCDSAFTCCTTPDGTWGCCPLEKAVCCADHIHCCPAHYQCDLHVFKCDHPFRESVPMLKKEPSKTKLSSNLTLAKVDIRSFSIVQCPDGISSCPEDTTCCELNDGSYGCCPYNDASCCSDKIHCCGNGYSCDESGKRCVKHISLFKTMEIDIIPSSQKLKSIKTKPLEPLMSLKDETCPDGKTKCSATTTCCPNQQNGQVTYSCCPYTKGVCCGTNGSVCCPNNYICDPQQLSCELNDERAVRKIRSDDYSNQCGSSDLACGDDQTCCRTYQSSDGEYACCAFPNAICCEDGRHCCPRGSQCDVHNGGCIQDY